MVGQTGLLDLGYVAFFAVGAYTTAKLTAENGTFTAWEVLFLAIVVAMAAGVTLGGPTLRLRGDYLAIVTLGFGEIVRIIAQNSGSLGEARGITDIPHPPKLPGLPFATEPLPYFYLVLACIVVAILLRRPAQAVARVGRAWAAIREDEDAAELMGVPTFKFKLWSFAMGASIGGLGGWIYAVEGRIHQPRHLPAEPVVPDPRGRRAGRARLDAGRHRRRVRRRLHPGVPPPGGRWQEPAQLPERCDR